ncbi:MAG TPA: hypothetical protein VGC16_05265 [Rhizomicrobium sp.]
MKKLIPALLLATLLPMLGGCVVYGEGPGPGYSSAAWAGYDGSYEFGGQGYGPGGYCPPGYGDPYANYGGYGGNAYAGYGGYY